ncbi:MAG: gliding motility-associated C-terminal domain-containing protein [Chitinophagales bacterium]|nr:gliding motility-associated C-terminal domain-containing protein [Chitinophagales bacterium]MDW8427413.1 gliding motility-associated C-terminal domain-containing protein [Chitinophagales bacterium]
MADLRATLMVFFQGFALLPAGWAQPMAGFTVNDSVFCAPALITAQNVSVGQEPLGVSWFLNQELISETAFHLSYVISACGLMELTLIVTDSSGAQDTASQMIYVHCPPMLDLGSDISLCSGDTISLNAQTSATLLWQPATGLSNPYIAQPLCFVTSTTLYVVTATDTNGCNAQDSILVTVNPLPEVTVTAQSSVYCVNTGEVQLWGLPEGGSFGGTAVSTDGLFSPPSAGVGTFTIKYTYTDSLGCSASDSVTIEVVDLPIMNVAEDTAICLGDTLVLSVSGVTVVSWSPADGLAQTDSLITLAFPTSTTTYIINGSDGLCTVVDSIKISVNPKPLVFAGNDTIACAGIPLWLQASGAEQYFWTPPNLVSDPDQAWTQFIGTQNSTLVLIGTDSNGCSNIDSVTITYVSVSDVILTPDTFICAGSSLQLNSIVADEYHWVPASGLSSDVIANPIAAPLLSASYVLTVLVNGCTFSEQISIAVQQPSVNAGPPSLSVCQGDTAQLFASGALFYQWWPVSGLSNPFIPNPYAYPSDTTWYFVTGTDSYGCSATDSIVLFVLPLPQVYIFADTSLCAGDTIPMYAVGGLYYSWQPTAGLSAPLNNSTLASPNQTTTYTVTVTDFKGCQNMATHTIYVRPKPDAEASGPEIVCAGIPIQLEASGGIYYVWQPITGLTNAFISNPQAVIYTSTTYTVTVTNAYFCTDTAQLQLHVQPPLEAFVCRDTTICMGDSAFLWAGGGLDYLWWPSESLVNPQSPNTWAAPQNTTTYSVIVRDACYADTLYATVIVQPPPVVWAGPDLHTVAGVDVEIVALASPGTYQWEPSTGLSCAQCLNPTVNLLETTTYVLTVTDSLGCTATDSLTVWVGCAEQVIFIPNVFTPNGNGLNDVLYVRTTGVEDLVFFRIYDRWGKRIFETNSLDRGWDGRYNGQEMPAGTYLYEWQARCLNGELIQGFGNVTLLR